MGINLKRSSGLPSQGVHLFKITKAEEKESTSGNPMWVLTCVCQTAGDDQGLQMPVFLSLTDAARFKVDEFLDAIEADKHGSLEVGECVGKLLRIAVQHAPYQGNMRANPFKMLPASSKQIVDIPAPPELPGNGIPFEESSAPARRTSILD